MNLAMGNSKGVLAILVLLTSLGFIAQAVKIQGVRTKRVENRSTARSDLRAQAGFAYKVEQEHAKVDETFRSHYIQLEKWKNETTKEIEKVTLRANNLANLDAVHSSLVQSLRTEASKLNARLIGIGMQQLREENAENLNQDGSRADPDPEELHGLSIQRELAAESLDRIQALLRENEELIPEIRRLGVQFEQLRQEHVKVTNQLDSYQRSLESHHQEVIRARAEIQALRERVEADFCRLEEQVGNAEPSKARDLPPFGPRVLRGIVSRARR